MGSQGKFVTAAAMAFALAACGSASETDAAAGEGTNDMPASEMAAGEASPAADAMAPAGAPTAAPEFVAMAASGGMYEVESSKLAQAQASNAEVKTFAEQMIRDHTKANNELKAAAAKATPPATVPATMNPKHQGMVDQLKAAGANFDRTYLDQQRTAHQETLALLDGYIAGGGSQPLKDWASKTRAPVQQHLDMVNQIAGKM